MKNSGNNTKSKIFNMLDDLRCDKGGKEKILPSQEFVFENHDSIRLIAIASGSGIMSFNKKEYAIRTNDLFFAYPGYDCSFMSSSFSKTELYWCDIKGDNVNLFLDNINVNLFSPVLYGVNNLNIIKEMRILKSAYTNLSFADFLNYKGSVYKIFSVLLNEFGEKQWSKVSHTSRDIVYYGNWLPWPSESKIETGEYYASDNRSFAELSFYGSGIKWYGVMNFDCGIADIIVDENYVVSVDTYSHERITGQILYSDNTLSEGNHVIKIVCTGTKNHLSKGTDIVVEGFQVYSDNNSMYIDEKARSGYLGRIIEYIDANYTKDENISEIAERAGVSRSFFTTRFKKETGYSPKQYINGLRLSKAKEYLCTTDHSIMEIAELCGYSDASYFMKVFKQSEKMTVMQYRKLHRK